MAAVHMEAKLFLEEHGLGFAAAAFEAEGFRTAGDMLDARLTDTDLKELGLVQMMPRKRLQNALADMVQADGASVGGSAPVTAPSLPAGGEPSVDDLQAAKRLTQEHNGLPLKTAETATSAVQPKPTVQLDVSPHREAWAKVEGGTTDSPPQATLQQPRRGGSTSSSSRRRGKLTTLESAIYSAALSYRALQDDKYRPLKHLLVELFASVDSGARIRQPRSGFVEPGSFVEVLSVRLGLETTENEAIALFGKHGPFEELNYQAFCRYLCAKRSPSRAQLGNLSGGESFELAADEISAVDVRGSATRLEPEIKVSPQQQQQPGAALSPPASTGTDPAWRRSAEELLLKEQRDQDRAAAARAAHLEKMAHAATKHTRRVASVSQREQHRHSGVAATSRRLEKHKQQETAAERALLRVSAVREASVARCQKHDAHVRKIRRNARRDRELRASQSAERKLELQEMTIRAEAVRRAALDEEASRARMFARRRREKRRASRRSGEEWAALAEAEAVVACTFTPALPKKISYHHVASKAERAQLKGNQPRSTSTEDISLRSIGDRTLAAQRQSLQLMRERRGNILDAQHKEVVRIQRQSVGGGKAQLSRGFRRGAFEADDPSEWQFEGMVKHRLCKISLPTPKNWGTIARNTCERSASKPDVWLQLEHVFGYNGPKNIQPNVFYTAAGHVLYYTSAVGIIYNPVQNQQKFYLGHEDEISCLTLHPDRDTVATGGTGAVPKLQIWSATTMKPPADVEGCNEEGARLELEMASGDQYVLCMAFSPHGQWLMTISANNDHNVRLWDWKNKEILGHSQGMKGIAPQVFGIIWNPWMVKPEDRDPAVPIFAEAPQGTEWMPYDFITVGAKHVWFWRYEPGGPAHGADHKDWTPDLHLPENPCILVKKDPMYGSKGTRQNVYHGTFLPSGHVLTANHDGSIGVWQKNQCCMEKPAHDGAIKVMRLRADNTTLVTAGADGHVRVWKVTSTGSHMPVSIEQLKDVDLVDPDAVREGIPPQCFTSLDVVESVDDDTIVAADDNSDIWELSYLDDDPPRIMVEGQSGEVSGLATHPTISELYATACTDGHVCLWDATKRRNVKVMRIERGREEVEPGQPMKICKSEVTGRTTDYFYKDWRGRVPPKASERAIKALKAGHKEGDHLQAWACAFSQQGDMLAVTTSGVVDDEQALHEDQGGCVVVYCVDEQLLTYSPDPQEKDYVPPKIWEAKIGSTPIDCVAFSPCGRYLACGSHDTLIQILDVKHGFRCCGTCVGHSSTIKTLDWSDDSRILRSSSADYELMYWNPRGKLIVGDDQADTRWTSWTSPLGFDVMGIYSNGMGGGDINAVARSQEQQWVVVADDSGLVRLLNYPSVVKAAPGYGHRGHASHVERVAFLAHDYRVISCGGADAATYQWKIRGPGKPPLPPTGVDLGSVLTAATAGGKFKLKASRRRQSHWQWDASQAEEEAAAKIQAVVRGRNQRRNAAQGENAGGGRSNTRARARHQSRRLQHQAHVSFSPGSFALSSTDAER